jgi:hypothetical protein
MTDDLELAKLREASQNALIYALMKDADQFGEAIEQIVQMGPRAVHAALCGWSGLTLHAFEQDQGPAGEGDWWGVEVEDARTGKVVSLDKVTDPATRDAMRLVSCIGNKDHATIAAIVHTAWDADDDGETLASLMVRSVTIAADMAGHLRERRENDTREAS